MSLSDKIKLKMAELEAERRANLRRAADLYASELREVLDVPGTRERPSRPGEAPHRVTGRLRGSVEVQVDEAAGVATVRATAPYARYLAPTRPFYRLAFARCRDRLRQILLGR